MSPNSHHIATKQEIAWCNKMRSLMAQKPDSITLFCNGWMHALSTEEVNAHEMVNATRAAIGTMKAINERKDDEKD